MLSAPHRGRRSQCGSGGASTALRRSCRASTTGRSTSRSGTWPDYRLTCFFIDRDCRRRGVSSAALRGALDLIAQGGGVVEAYPRDTQGKKLSASHLYNGTRSQFEKAGFEFVRSKGEFNGVMRITIEPA